MDMEQDGAWRAQHIDNLVCMHVGIVGMDRACEFTLIMVLGLPFQVFMVL